MPKLLLRTISIILFVTQISGDLFVPLSSLPSTTETAAAPTASYSLNLNQSIDINLNGTLRLEDVLEVFNIRTVSSKWNHISERITKKCSNDMSVYLNGLKNLNSWAVKSKFFLAKII